MNRPTQYGQIREYTEKLRDIKMDRWLHHDLFSFGWWLLVVLMILPWLLWWKVCDQKKLVELICVGSLTALVATVFNVVGTANLWWMYHNELTVAFPGLLVPDITDIPVAFMLLYQYFSTWKSFLISSTVLAIFFSYIVEPAFQWMGIYEPISWKHTYSFVIYIAMAALIRLFVLKIKKPEPRAD